MTLPANGLGRWIIFLAGDRVNCPACMKLLTFHVGERTALRLRWVGVKGGNIIASPGTCTVRCERCLNWLEMQQAHPTQEAA